MIQRYDPPHDIVPDDDGEYVLYRDYLILKMERRMGDNLCFTVDVGEIYKDGKFGDEGIGSRLWNDERNFNYKVVGIFGSLWTLYKDFT